MGILALAHEHVEFFFVHPYAGNRSFLLGDPENRWVGEGLANLVLARARGLERPLAAFAKWLRGFPSGPRYVQVAAWMSEVSGLDIAREAEAVPIDEVLEHGRNRSEGP